MVQPSDHTSDARVAPCSWMISGAIQYGVPTTSWLNSSSVLSDRETPKSVSLITPFLQREQDPSWVSRRLAPQRARCPAGTYLALRMLAHLMSQWTTFWLCRYSSPSIICRT